MSPLLVGVSFASVLAAFTLVALYFRPSRFSLGAPRRRLRIAALGTAIWAMPAWGVAVGYLPGYGVAAMLELGLLSLWLWQLESFAAWQHQPSWFRVLLKGGALTIFALSALSLVRPGYVGAADEVGRILAIAGLLGSVLGLLALEQMYRNAVGGVRAALRWFCLGVGTVFVTLLISFAEMLLFGGIPTVLWVAHGVLFTSSACALVMSARRMPNWTVGMTISRQMAFYTTSIAMVGVYLVVLSVAETLLASLPGVWEELAKTLVWSMGLAILAFALFSDRFRGKVRVFVESHLFAQRYDYRAEWLRFIRTLSELDATDPLPQRAILAVAQIIDSPRGVLWKRSRDGSIFECAATWPQGAMAGSRSPIAADDPLVRFLERTTWLIDLREFGRAPQVYGDLDIVPARYSDDPAALIVPLMRGEALYGWLVLTPAPSLGDLNFEDRDLLKTAGRVIAVHLSQNDADTLLAESQQFEAYNRMAAFVMHDLKNVAAQLKLISQNAERHRRNPEFVDDAMRTIGSSAARMSNLIAQIASVAQGAEPQFATMQTIDLAMLAERAALRCGGQAPVPQVIVLARPSVFVDAERIVSIIEHGIRNAQDATPPSGEVLVEVSVVDGRPVLAIVDNGCGMDEAFVRDRLFRPFNSTKGARGMGIGAFQIRECLRSIGGTVEVHSTPDEGTRFEMWFPKPVREVLELQARASGGAQ